MSGFKKSKNFILIALLAFFGQIKSNFAEYVGVGLQVAHVGGQMAQMANVKVSSLLNLGLLAASLQFPGNQPILSSISDGLTTCHDLSLDSVTGTMTLKLLDNYTPQSLKDSISSSPWLAISGSLLLHVLKPAIGKYVLYKGDQLMHYSSMPQCMKNAYAKISYGYTKMKNFIQKRSFFKYSTFGCIILYKVLSDLQKKQAIAIL